MTERNNDMPIEVDVNKVIDKLLQQIASQAQQIAVLSTMLESLEENKEG